jgi:predicted peptidase
MMSATDPEIQAVLDENADKFEQFVFDDPATGISLEYSLYIPEGYDESASYPLLMFIPDATGAGKTARQIVEQYYGAAVWVTDEDQAKHASFVLVPAFSETVVNDDWSVSEQVETAVNLIAQLQKDYSIDANRLYTTGQSMGCMTSLYLNSKYPDLFAASMFVSGQWDISVLKPLEEKTFFYITAGGDVKASGGQDEVMAMLDADGVPYSFGTWSAQNSSEEQVEAVNVLLAEGNPINMVRFETGTVFKEGESGMEHMASFNYGYRLSAVRDWLFAQSK